MTCDDSSSAIHSTTSIHGITIRSTTTTHDAHHTLMPPTHRTVRGNRHA